jgi:membrane peptidoglycan carboxypeptidase
MNDDTDRIRRLIKSEQETQGIPPPEESSGEPPRRNFQQPALDRDNMPLPKRVGEIDMDGTGVSPAAYEPVNQIRGGTGAGSTAGASLATRISALWHGNMGCLVRGMIAMTFLAAIVGLCLLSYLLYQYYSIARALPAVGDLRTAASQFETTRILDRSGALLYEILDPTAGRRTYIPLGNISPNLVAATIATEDKEFFTHPGYDFTAMLRALWQNYTSGGTVSGASTITQQLARALLLSPEERAQRTYTRKAREIVLAAEITRRYTKDQILELYLNEIYYGNLAYGVEAAAETYFGKTAGDLTLGEASFLAGLPQSPSIYDIYTNPDAALLRQQHVLVLMFDLSKQQDCIEVSNSPTRICVDPLAATNAAGEMKDYNFRPPVFDIKYPHWVNFVRSELEKQFDAQTIYRSGFTVYTTLDPVLQDQAQQMVTAQVATMVDRHATDGALVAIQPATGQILAMVGSPDFYNEAISGQVNMATSQTRQPGSSIKPVNYVAAFEKGWTPATLIWDVPSEFPPSGDPNDPREPYQPVNYDEKFHGPVTVRVALANSFNVPAVKTLNFVGIWDNPETPQKDGMIAMAERLGITSFTRDDYGLSLTLGGGDVSLLEHTGAFSVFANGGARVPAVAILKITDFLGNVIYEYQPPAGDQVIRAEHAYLISSILSDNEARSWMFGRNSLLNLPFKVAAKTGTTNDFRDNWTMGYTPDLAVGVWIGNADYTPMINTTGGSGAAPIWNQFMQFAVPYVSGGNPTWMARPGGIVDRVVCTLSGSEPSNWCQNEYTEIFAQDQLPLPPGQDLIRRMNIDLWTGFQASSECSGPSEEELVLNVTDPSAKRWLDTGDGRNWLENNGLPRDPYFAPERECRSGDPQPVIDLNLTDGQIIVQPFLQINGSANAEQGFRRWRLEYGLGADPNSWNGLTDSDQPVDGGLLYTWDMSGLPNGTIAVRLTLVGEHTDLEEIRYINLNLATPTAPATDTPVPTDTPLPFTASPVPTDTPVFIPDTETPTP